MVLSGGFRSQVWVAEMKWRLWRRRSGREGKSVELEGKTVVCYGEYCHVESGSHLEMKYSMSGYPHGCCFHFCFFGAWLWDNYLHACHPFQLFGSAYCDGGRCILLSIAVRCNRFSICVRFQHECWSAEHVGEVTRAPL